MTITNVYKVPATMWRKWTPAQRAYYNHLRKNIVRILTAEEATEAYGEIRALEARFGAEPKRGRTT